MVFIKKYTLDDPFYRCKYTALIAINEYRCLLVAGIHLIPYLTCLLHTTESVALKRHSCYLKEITPVVPVYRCKWYTTHYKYTRCVNEIHLISLFTGVYTWLEKGMYRFINYRGFHPRSILQISLKGLNLCNKIMNLTFSLLNQER